MDWSLYDTHSDLISYYIHHQGLDCGVDLGPVGGDLEGPGLAPGVDLGPS